MLLNLLNHFFFVSAARFELILSLSFSIVCFLKFNKSIGGAASYRVLPFGTAVYE